MRKKIMLACLCIILVCLVLLATDKRPRMERPREEREGLRVALSQSEALTPWKTAQINSFKEAAEGRGLELVYHSPEEETLTWQLQDIRELFAEGIDYLILVPRVRSGYDDILLEAKERGIPVILAEQEVEMDEPVQPRRILLKFCGSRITLKKASCVRISWRNTLGSGHAIPW